MKETSSHNKGLINACLSCYSFLSDMVARAFVIYKFTVKEGGGRGAQRLSIRWLSRRMIFSPTYIQRVCTVSAWQPSLMASSSWNRLPLGAQLTSHLKWQASKKREWKPRFPKFTFLSIIRRHNVPRCIWVVDNLITMLLSLITYYYIILCPYNYGHHNQSPPAHEDWALSPMTVNSKL